MTFNNLTIRFVKLDAAATLPFYASSGAAGADLYSIEEAVLAPTERRLIRTGLGCDLLPGFEIQVRPRSGLAFKHGVTVLNTPGTIDSDYRGEIAVLLINHGDENFYISVGDRIAQIVVAEVSQTGFKWTNKPTETERGGGGFGSTGQ